MKPKGLNAWLLGAVPLLLIGANAWGGDGVDVTITNDGIDDIVVTVYDVSVGTPTVVLAHARINGFTSVPLTVMPDAEGQASVSWTAVSTDSASKKCGHAEKVGLGNASSINVHADSSCTASNTSS